MSKFNNYLKQSQQLFKTEFLLRMKLILRHKAMTQLHPIYTITFYRFYIVAHFPIYLVLESVSSSFESSKKRKGPVFLLCKFVKFLQVAGDMLLKNSTSSANQIQEFFKYSCNILTNQKSHLE